MPLVLGGDHSLAAGSVAAAADWATATRELPIGLLWVDAHGDMNTPATSPSGNVHGMPLAALLGPEPAELSRIGGFSPKVLPEHTVLVGVRNLDEREKVAVRDSHVHVFTMKDIDRQGIASIVEQAVELAGNGTAGIHVSFDMDVCDPTIAPGVGTPVKGGLDYREAHMVMEIVADSGLLTSLDLVEVNPTLDVRNTHRAARHRAGAVGARDEDSVSRRFGEHLFERLDQQHQRIRLLDEPGVRPQALELSRFRRHAREDDHRDPKRVLGGQRGERVLRGVQLVVAEEFEERSVIGSCPTW